MSGPLSVVVPTFRRPAQLEHCLGGLGKRRVAPDEIPVVRRSDDLDTAAVLQERWSQLVRVVTAPPGGYIAALAAGARATTGDLVAFTDDDAVPRPDWVERLRRHLADTSVGAVGCRDALLWGPAPAAQPSIEVGRISRWGRLTGEHHRGAGPAREVAALKGANMAWRREALALPVGMRGTGSPPHLEVAACLWERARSWRLIYDPAIVVDHDPGARFAGDRRARPDCSAASAEAHNLTAAIAAVDLRLLRRRALYGLLVGDRAVPGLGRAAAAALRGEAEVLRRLLPSLAGQLRALLMQGLGRGVVLAPLEPSRVRQGTDIHLPTLDRGG